MTDRPHDRPEAGQPAEHARETTDDGRVYVPWSRVELPEKPNGWHAPELVDHPDRPDARDIHLPADRRTHILDGDPDTPGGGHRAGTERPGKTEFPERWTDPLAVARITEIARNPDQPPVQQHNRRWRCEGTRDGVTVTVIVWPEGKIWAAWPQRGGRGVTKNPD